MNEIHDNKFQTQIKKQIDSGFQIYQIVVFKKNTVCVYV